MSSTEDLKYLISFDVQGTEKLDDVKTAIDDIDEKAGELDNGEPVLDLGLEGLDTAETDIGNMGTALGNLDEQADTSKTKMGGFSDAMGKFGLTSIGVGEAIEIATAAIEIGRQAWDRLNRDTLEAARRTAEFSDALLEVSGIMGEIEGSLSDSDNPFGVLAESLAAVEGVDITAAAIALGRMSLTVDDLGSAVAHFAGAEGFEGFFEGAAAAAGVSFEEFERFRTFFEDTVYDMSVIDLDSDVFSGMSDEMREVAEAYLDLDAIVGDLEFDDIAKEQLEVARGADIATQSLVAMAEAAAGPDASDFEIWWEFMKLQEAAAAAERFATGLDNVRDAIGSVEWDAAELSGATTGMATFSDQLFAADNAIQSFEEAVNGLDEAMGGGALNFDVTTDSGRAMQDAVEGIAAALDTKFVDAFDAANGDMDAFMASAKEIGEATLVRLADQLNLSTEQVDMLRTALGLTDDDYEARWNFSADEEAIQKLGLLQAGIESLPKEVQMQVNAEIAAGNPQEALDILLAFYADPANAVNVDVKTRANQEEFAAQIAAIEAEGYVVTIPAEPNVDPADIEEQIAALESQGYVVTLETEAGDGAQEDIEGQATRTYSDAIIVARAHTTIAEARLDTVARRTRDSNIYARTPNADVADNRLNTITNRNRTASIDVRTGSVDLISHDAIVNRITQGRGAIRIPVDTYPRYTARVDGSRGYRS